MPILDNIIHHTCFAASETAIPPVLSNLAQLVGESCKEPSTLGDHPSIRFPTGQYKAGDEIHVELRHQQNKIWDANYRIQHRKDKNGWEVAANAKATKEDTPFTSLPCQNGETRRKGLFTLDVYGVKPNILDVSTPAACPEKDLAEKCLKVFGGGPVGPATDIQFRGRCRNRCAKFFQDCFGGGDTDVEGCPDTLKEKVTPALRSLETVFTTKFGVGGESKLWTTEQSTEVVDAEKRTSRTYFIGGENNQGSLCDVRTEMDKAVADSKEEIIAFDLQGVYETYGIPVPLDPQNTLAKPSRLILDLKPQCANKADFLYELKSRDLECKEVKNPELCDFSIRKGHLRPDYDNPEWLGKVWKNDAQTVDGKRIKETLWMGKDKKLHFTANSVYDSLEEIPFDPKQESWGDWMKRTVTGKKPGRRYKQVTRLDEMEQPTTQSVYCKNTDDCKKYNNYFEHGIGSFVLEKEKRPTYDAVAFFNPLKARVHCRPEDPKVPNISEASYL